MSRIRWFVAGAAPLALWALSACTAVQNGSATGGAGGEGGGWSTGGDMSSSSSSGQGGEGGDLFSDGGLPGTGGGTPGDGCSDDAKLVYVIGQDNKFYSFYPPTLEVTLRGVLSCPSSGATPFSMAVDRKGIAWVLFSDGKIYHVDVKTVACSPSAYVANQQGFNLFGMGFVADSPGSTSETLYVADYNGKGLGRIDTSTLQLSFVGAYDQLSGLAAELTGTGDARVFGFYNKTPIIIAEIDKTNGKILSQAPQPSVSVGSGWAFAFWGGDFWLFTSPTGDSQIDRYSPSNATTTTVKTNLGTNIVGAGVSTCAPVKPPA